MKKLTGITAGVTMLLIAGFVVNSCSKKSSTPPPPPKDVSIKTSTTLGKYLADKNGNTLYSFAIDVKGQSLCAGTCAVNWTPYRDSTLAASSLDDSLKIADFSTITNANDGKKQLTYRGWPLYTYNPGGVPETAGQTSGDGVAGFWFVAKPDYTIMLASTQLIGKDGVHYKSDYTAGDGNTTYFTDSKGLTLYIFKKDSANLNKFTKPDFSNNATFPILDTTAAIIPSILNKTLFTNTNVYGHHQLTYNGWPLYYYVADSTTRGNNHGITIGGAAGTVWPVAIKDLAAAPHL